MALYDARAANVPMFFTMGLCNKKLPAEAGSLSAPVTVFTAGEIRMHGDLAAVEETTDSAGYLFEQIHITYLCGDSASGWWG